MNKYKYTKGMVLISVLIFISLVTLLVTFGLQVSELEMRMSNNKYQNTKLLQAAQYGLESAIQNVQKHNVACKISTNLSSYDLLTKPKSWWYSNATCHGKFATYNYYYVIRALQINPCLYFQDSRAVQYWFVSVRTEHAKNQNFRLVLQANETCQLNCVYAQKRLHRRFSYN